MSLTVADIFAGAGGSSTECATRIVAGNVRYRVAADGRVFGVTGRVLRPHAIPGGYLRVTLDGRHRLIHGIVAENFIGPRPAGHQVNHIDGDKANNAVTNLEYVSPSQNVRHSIDVLGVIRARGERNANAVLTEADVIAMRSAHERGENAADIARSWGIDPGHAWRIVTGRSWRHVPC